MAFNLGDRVVVCSYKGNGNEYRYTKIGTTGEVIGWNTSSLQVRWNLPNLPEYEVNKKDVKLIEETNMVDSIKEYVKEHKSIIMTIAVVLIVDHLVFNGAFREKVKSLVDGLLNKATKQLEDK